MFAVGVSARYPLVLLANRDEAYARPTSPAAFWTEEPRVFGGRDVLHGGTWLGVTTGGRFAAVTNVRAAGSRREGRSRGIAVAGLLTADAPLDSSLDALADASSTFPAFNILAGDASGVRYLADDARPVPVASGVHGLSNARLDSSWPKVERSKKQLALELEKDELDREALFAMASDRSRADDNHLPTTGVDRAIERALSPAFIVAPGYGTRSISLVVFEAGGSITFEERSFGEGGVALGIVSQRIV